MQPAPSRRVGSREIRVAGGIDHPDRLGGSVHLPRQADPRRERDAFAQGLEFRSTFSGMPRGDAAQGVVVGPRLPHCSELPSQRSADGLQNGCVCLDRPLGFGEDSGDRVFHTLEIARVSEPSLRPLDVCHRYS
jgi:hypothetical protein